MKYIFALLLVFIAGCDSKPSVGLQGSVERSGRPIATTVYFYEDQRQVQDKYREVHKLPSSAKVAVSGFAKWPEFRDEKGKPLSDAGQALSCEIHVVRPAAIDDQSTLTLGHEMLHCVIGTYHVESLHQ